MFTIVDKKFQVTILKTKKDLLDKLILIATELRKPLYVFDESVEGFYIPFTYSCLDKINNLKIYDCKSHEPLNEWIFIIQKQNFWNLKDR